MEILGNKDGRRKGSQKALEPNYIMTTETKKKGFPVRKTHLCPLLFPHPYSMAESLFKTFHSTTREGNIAQSYEISSKPICQQ